VHAPELIESGGHHAAYSTALAETSHKDNIKIPAKYSKTYGSFNQSQKEMLNYVLFHKLLAAVLVRNEEVAADIVPAVDADQQPVPGVEADQQLTPAADEHTTYKMIFPLPYTEDWYLFVTQCNRFPAGWRSTFLSNKVLVTREELATQLLVKLGMELSLKNLVRVVTDLQWKCFGAVCLYSADGFTRRTVVGCDSKGGPRRDFVRLRGVEGGTALSAQVQLSIT